MIYTYLRVLLEIVGERPASQSRHEKCGSFSLGAIVEDALIAATVRKALRRPRILSSLDQRVNLLWDVLLVGADERGIVENLSLKDLEEILHVSRPTIIRAINCLTKLRLVIKEIPKRGRGARARYIIRPMYAVWVRMRNQLHHELSSRRTSFPQQKGTPRSYMYPQRDYDSKDAPPRSPGQIMGAVRRVSQFYFQPHHALAIQNTVGRMLFKEGRFQHFTRPVLRDVFNLLTARPPDTPPPEAPPRAVYAWIRGQIEKIIRRHASGLAQLMSDLLKHLDWASADKFSTEKGKGGRKGAQGRRLLARDPGEPRRRELVAIWA